MTVGQVLALHDGLAEAGVDDAQGDVQHDGSQGDEAEVLRHQDAGQDDHADEVDALGQPLRDPGPGRPADVVRADQTRVGVETVQRLGLLRRDQAR